MFPKGYKAKKKKNATRGQKRLQPLQFVTPFEFSNSNTLLHQRMGLQIVTGHSSSQLKTLIFLQKKKKKKKEINSFIYVGDCGEIFD